jgi:transcriptional regulator with PAS, ATPase and Fis domain
MSVVCAALPDSLLESELMGHEMGAFTDAKKLKKGLFELADGGTIYLDEIGEMPINLQVKLLGLIEGKSFKRLGGSREIQVNVRIIAASNKNLQEEVKRGAFRLDLFHRLNVFPINLPPLRERAGDILPLAEHFIDIISADFKKPRPTITPEAAEFLLKYHWPGNVRELRNLIERALILHEGEACLSSEILPPELTAPNFSENSGAFQIIRLTGDGINLQELEQDLIRQALSLTNGNKTQAANLLGLKRDSLRRKMERYGLQ